MTERRSDGVSGNGRNSRNIGGRFGRDGMRFGWDLMAKGWSGIWFMTDNHHSPSPSRHHSSSPPIPKCELLSSVTHMALMIRQNRC